MFDSETALNRFMTGPVQRFFDVRNLSVWVKMRKKIESLGSRRVTVRNYQWFVIMLLFIGAAAVDAEAKGPEKKGKDHWAGSEEISIKSDVKDVTVGNLNADSELFKSRLKNPTPSTPKPAVSATVKTSTKPAPTATAKSSAKPAATPSAKAGTINSSKQVAHPSLKLNTKTIKFNDGGYYIGIVKNNKPDGKGKLYNKQKQLVCDCEYKNGDPVSGTTYIFGHPEHKTYTGQYKVTGSKSFYHGQGTLLYHTGAKYTGQFVLGKFSGEGSFYDPQGVKTVFGKWEKNELVEGTQVTATGEQFTGKIVQGVLQGKGSILLPSGEKIEGDFVHGSITKGSIHYKDRSVYNGEIGGYRANGQGVVTDASGKTRKQGMFVENVLMQGSLTDDEGNTYTGMFSQEHLLGEGEMKNVAGDLFKGSFQNNDLNYGSVEYADGSKYTGQLREMKPDGSGRYFNAGNGLTYEALFVDGKMTGDVRVTGADDKMHFERWENGKFIEVTSFE